MEIDKTQIFFFFYRFVLKTIAGQGTSNLRSLRPGSKLINNHLARSEVKMAPHSSTLAWKIPWAEEPGELQSMGSLGVGHD